MEEYKKKIKQIIDRFYVECIDEFKEAELRIANDSKFRTMFRKKDYRGNIEILRGCKKATRSLRFPMGDIPKDDSLTRDLVHQTELCIRQFNRLCDSYIQMQTALQGKSEGKPLSYGEYKEVYYRTQEDNVEMNRQLKELDLLYTDFLDDEDYDVYEFIK
ncbi:MAG: hypothetical protein IJ109_09760 [Firmicutes bacterium]|nr:hypothetical protein [Bacillota bacterium]MBQ9060279.1 hypothetical protein [Bacillota bacterium]